MNERKRWRASKESIERKDNENENAYIARIDYIDREDEITIHHNSHYGKIEIYDWDKEQLERVRDAIVDALNDKDIICAER